MQRPLNTGTKKPLPFTARAFSISSLWTHQIKMHTIRDNYSAPVRVPRQLRLRKSHCWWFAKRCKIIHHIWHVPDIMRKLF